MKSKHRVSDQQTVRCGRSLILSSWRIEPFLPCRWWLIDLIGLVDTKRLNGEFTRWTRGGFGQRWRLWSRTRCKVDFEFHAVGAIEEGVLHWTMFISTLVTENRRDEFHVFTVGMHLRDRRWNWWTGWSVVDFWTAFSVFRRYYRDSRN